MTRPTRVHAINSQWTAGLMVLAAAIGCMLAFGVSALVFAHEGRPIPGWILTAQFLFQIAIGAEGARWIAASNRRVHHQS